MKRRNRHPPSPASPATAARGERVEDLLRESLSQVIAREVRDPRVRLATVTSVRASRNLEHARVLVSVLGPEEEREACITALQNARGFLRSQLAARLKLRTVPELRFELDRGAEHSQQIEELLQELGSGGDS